MLYLKNFAGFPTTTSFFFTFLVTTAPAPTIAFSPISNQTTQEDTPLTFDLDIVDIDGPFLVLNYEHTGNVEISFISNSITITPYLNWFGSTDITIIAFDGEFTAEQSFTLDGDLYPIQDVQRIRVGPPIQFIVGKK